MSTDFREVIDFSKTERQQLINFSVMPEYDLVCRLLKNMVISARENSAAVNPVDREKVIGAQAIAFSKTQMYQDFLAAFEQFMADSLAEHKQAEAKAVSEDQAFVESVVMGQAQGLTA